MLTDDSNNQEEQDKEAFKLAKMAALELLSRREHSSLELQRKLSRRSKFATIDFDTLFSELKTNGWLSHQRFAESFIRSRRNKGQGPIRIVHELKQRGLNEHEFSNILSAYDDWYSLAYETLLKRARVWSEDTKTQAKLTRFLMQRGFDFEAIKYAMAELRQVSAER